MSYSNHGTQHWWPQTSIENNNTKEIEWWQSPHTDIHSWCKGGWGQLWSFKVVHLHRCRSTFSKHNPNKLRLAFLHIEMEFLAETTMRWIQCKTSNNWWGMWVLTKCWNNRSAWQNIKVHHKVTHSIAYVNKGIEEGGGILLASPPRNLCSTWTHLVMHCHIVVVNIAIVCIQRCGNFDRWKQQCKRWCNILCNFFYKSPCLKNICLWRKTKEELNEPLGAKGPPLVGEEVRKKVGT